MTSEEIKAIRMKLAAKKPGGRFKGKSSIGGTYRSVKPFNEQLHPRGPGGKFASKPGGGEREKNADRIKVVAIRGGGRNKTRMTTHVASRTQAAAVKKLYASGASDHAVDRAIDGGSHTPARLARAKELRAARAAKRQEQAKPSLKEQAAAHRAKKGAPHERATSLLSKARELRKTAPKGTPNRKKIDWENEQRFQKRLHRLKDRTASPEQVQKSQAIQAKQQKEQERIDLEKRRTARIKRTVQSGLRKQGYARETTSKSGSQYYMNSVGERVRISDHNVPESVERFHNASHGGFSWATGGNQFVIDDYATRRKARQFLNSLAKRRAAQSQ